MKWGAMAVAFLLAAFFVQPVAAQSAPIEEKIEPETASPTASDRNPSAGQEIKLKSPYVAGGLAVGSYAGLAGIASISAVLLPKHDGWNYYFIPPLALAVTVAPSAGHFYTEEYLHAIVFSGLRLALFGSAAIAFPHALLSDNPKAGATVAVGLLGWLSLTIYDFIDAPRSARRYNERKRMERMRSGENR